MKRHGAQGVAYVLALFAGSPDFQPLKAASEGVILASEWSYPDTPFIATGRAWDDFSAITSRLVWEVGVASVPPIKEFLSRPECSKCRGVISFLAIFQDVTALEHAVLLLKECIASNPVPKSRWRRYWAQGSYTSLDITAWDAFQILQYFSQQALEANGVREVLLEGLECFKLRFPLLLPMTFRILGALGRKEDIPVLESFSTYRFEKYYIEAKEAIRAIRAHG